MHHIFFTHSHVDGHLGCFHVLAIVNSAAVDVGSLVSFQTRALSGEMPRNVLLDHTVTLFFFSIFWGTCMLFSIVVAPAYLLSSSVGGLPLGGEILTHLYFT